MLTPQEISGKEFVKAVFGGYDMSAVDDFLENLSSDYSLLYKENAILKSKIKVLVEKVEEYRSTEDAMRMALLTAQKMGDDLLADARKKSGEILSEAQAQADSKLRELAILIKEEFNRLNAAKAATASFVGDSKALIEKHSDFLSKLDSLKLPEPEPAAPPTVSREKTIVDAAREIDTAVSKLVDEAASPVNESAKQELVPDKPEYDDESEPTKVFPLKSDELQWPGSGDDEDSTSPKPKFDFNNLKFGRNFKDGE